MPGGSLVNTDDWSSALVQAEVRVLEIQTKLHRWARDDRHRRFDDLFNLVAYPAFLLVAWDRVRGNKGARTAGVDGETVSSIEAGVGVEDFLGGLRSALRDRSFRPLPVRERMIPKAGGKLRRLGIAAICDRVVQASLKLVLEPIFEADFLPCSYGFRPGRRAHDAVAEVWYLSSKPRSYEWIVEGDIKACFDEISHPELMDRVRGRIGDRRVLDLVKAFLKSGVLGEDKELRKTTAGTPQGSILSPLLSNVALSVLDDYVAEVLSTMGLRLSPDNTLITHIDGGLDFLGWRLQRHRKRGASQHYVYTYPAKKSLRAVMAKVKTLCRQVGAHQTLDDLLRRLNPAIRGWCAYFRPGSSSATFAYLSHYV